MANPFSIDFLAKERIRELQREAEELRQARQIKGSRKPYRRHHWWR